VIIDLNLLCYHGMSVFHNLQLCGIYPNHAAQLTLLNSYSKCQSSWCSSYEFDCLYRITENHFGLQPVQRQVLSFRKRKACTGVNKVPVYTTPLDCTFPFQTSPLSVKFCSLDPDSDLSKLRRKYVIYDLHL
jgi:hypothetical protein